jgi:hypothetical protein
MNNSIKKTKLEIVLTHLVEVGNIAQREAIAICDSWRLSAIVCSLRKAGIQIVTRQEAHKGGFHARYYLIAEPQAKRHLKALKERSKSKLK